MRTTNTKTSTVVRLVCTPFGRSRNNPPSLAQLRQFVAECEGLPGDLRVYLEKGLLGEGGRHNYTLTARYDHPDEVEAKEG